MTNTNGQYYEMPTPETQHSDITNPLQIINTFSTALEPLKREVDSTNEVVPQSSLADVTSQCSDQEKVYKNDVKKANISEKKLMQQFGKQLKNF